MKTKEAAKILLSLSKEMKDWPDERLGSLLYMLVKDGAPAGFISGILGLMTPPPAPQPSCSDLTQSDWRKRYTPRSRKRKVIPKPNLAERILARKAAKETAP